MNTSGLGRQDGLIRESIKWFAIVVVLAVLVLDAVSTLQGQLAVHQNATDAANDALTRYIQSGGNSGLSMDSASALLKERGAVYVTGHIVPSASGAERAVAYITAKRSTHTYVFHYLTHAPWGIGNWFDKLLDPTATETSD